MGLSYFKIWCPCISVTCIARTHLACFRHSPKQTLVCVPVQAVVTHHSRMDSLIWYHPRSVRNTEQMIVSITASHTDRLDVDKKELTRTPNCNGCRVVDVPTYEQLLWRAWIDIGPMEVFREAWLIFAWSSCDCQSEPVINLQLAQLSKSFSQIHLLRLFDSQNPLRCEVERFSC